MRPLHSVVERERIMTHISNIIANETNWHDAQIGFRVDVEQYRYRTARVNHILFSTVRDCFLETKLAERAGMRKDNHTVYKITNRDTNESIYIWFTDSSMHIGLDVIEGDW